MFDVFQGLTALDHGAMDLTQSLRIEPLTEAFVVLSAWWVKGPLLVGLGVCGDLKHIIDRLRAGERRLIDRLRAGGARLLFPLAAACAAVAFFIASGLNALIKDAVDRQRPPEEMSGFDAAVALPGSHSFPSGHAMSAFAVATAIAVIRPSLRWPALGIATLVALSRPYLGVHFWLDVIIGAGLGALCGLAVASLGKRLARAPVGQPS